MVLVDTPIWSLALRRTHTDLNPRERLLTGALRDLVRDGVAGIIGPIRQEVLSGIRVESVFRKLRDQLRAFDEPALEAADFEESAHIHNQCRRRGIAGSPIDFVICAAAIRRGWQVFTTDRDFARYADVVELKLYGVN
ncbi:MAG: PIN domain-containing protein [Candidatus Sulfotelmatobacter sp.]